MGDGCRDFCLSVLRAAGAAVRAVEASGRTAYRVELPDELAWHWASRGRPCPALWLAFDEAAQGPGEDDGRVWEGGEQPGGGTAGAAAGEELPGPEPISPLSRRFWEIRALGLDLGWLGVFHQPARRHAPALWLWVETAADGGPLGLAPLPGPAVVWVSLAARPAPPAVCFLAGQGAGGRNPGPAPDGTGLTELALQPGPAPGVRLPRTGRVKLARALDQAVAAAAHAFLARPDVLRWLAGFPAGPPEAGPRLRLFLTMAALIDLDEAAPWPPPPRLHPLLPAARLAAAPCASTAPEAGSPGHGAAPAR